MTEVLLFICCGKAQFFLGLTAEGEVSRGPLSPLYASYPGLGEPRPPQHTPALVPLPGSPLCLTTLSWRVTRHLSFLISLLLQPLPERASDYLRLNSLTLVSPSPPSYPAYFSLIAVSTPNIYEFIYLLIVDLHPLENSLHESREYVTLSLFYDLRT